MLQVTKQTPKKTKKLSTGQIVHWYHLFRYAIKTFRRTKLQKSLKIETELPTQTKKHKARTMPCFVPQTNQSSRKMHTAMHLSLLVFSGSAYLCTVYHIFLSLSIFFQKTKRNRYRFCAMARASSSLRRTTRLESRHSTS